MQHHEKAGNLQHVIICRDVCVAHMSVSSTLGVFLCTRVYCLHKRPQATCEGNQGCTQPACAYVQCQLTHARSAWRCWISSQQLLLLVHIQVCTHFVTFQPHGRLVLKCRSSSHEAATSAAKSACAACMYCIVLHVLSSHLDRALYGRITSRQHCPSWCVSNGVQEACWTPLSQHRAHGACAEGHCRNPAARCAGLCLRTAAAVNGRPRVL
jgi:hypothetical protein